MKFKAVEELLYGMVKDDLIGLRDEVKAIQKQGYEEEYND
jgi:hypothetical protein